MNRAAPFRIEAYAMFTALGVNVVAKDYRGFGDSQGTPSEEGLQRDARATYKWIRQRRLSESSVGENSPAIYIAGQSLGTGVAARLALDLYRVGECLF
jgi:abhydrolase domain-containing protein 12